MGIYNLTDRGVNSNPSVPPTTDSVSAVTYGAIGVGTIAILSIIIAFIYKAIKRARRSSSGGSYSPKSHHKENQETRRSSSNSENSEANCAVVDSTIITHAVVNETNGEAKKNTRNVKSRAPDPQKMHDEIPDENTKKESDLSNQGPSNPEVLNTDLTYDPLSQNEIIQQDDGTKKEISTDAVGFAHEEIIPKKNVIPINKPPRKIDKSNPSAGKFTSDKTAASNLNEDSLRSLGEALGGILKDQMPELDGNHKVGTSYSQKEEKDFANNSDELTSCTPPTTPTDLSDQEVPKNDRKVEENKTHKKSNVGGADIEGDSFFSSGEIELDTGSEYFSAEESSYAVKESTVESATPEFNSQAGYSNIQPKNENHFLGQKKGFVSADGGKNSIEKDIADSLIPSTHTSSQQKLLDIDAIKMSSRHRGISMCEDQSIDMEVHEILRGKQPYYQPPFDNPPVEDTASSEVPLTSNHQKRSHLSASVEEIIDDTNSKNLSRNANLQKIIKPAGSSTNQYNSGLDATTIVDETVKISKLDFVNTELIQEKTGFVQNISYVETEASSEHMKEEFLNINDSFVKDSLVHTKRTIESSLITDKILDIEFSDETLSELKTGSSKIIENNEQRNLIDFIVPKPESVYNQTPYFGEHNRSREKQQIEVEQKDFGAETFDGGEGDSFLKTPKWYVPFESSHQELTDPTRGNSDGLYIALSEETKIPLVGAETEKQDLNSSSGSPKKSCAYININGEGDKGWPKHISTNPQENNMSGLGLSKTVNTNSTRCAIKEEIMGASSNLAGEASETTQFTEMSKLLSKHTEDTNINAGFAGENIQSDIPQFQLPNMDKRLTKKRNLRRRQIKSLDSGVHSYYGEYMDLVEFPELEGGQNMTQNEELKTTNSNEETNNKNEYIESEMKEIKIEEDVVTILPDGSIREEKIVIDKISSTS